MLPRDFSAMRNEGDAALPNAAAMEFDDRVEIQADPHRFRIVANPANSRCGTAPSGRNIKQS